MQRNRNLLTIILFLINLGSSMYGLFTPIYYLTHEVPYSRVIVSLIFWCIGGVFAGIFSNYFIHRLGVKAFIVLRGLAEPLIILLLNSFPALRYPPEIQGFLSGYVIMSFWVSMDILTSSSTEAGKRGMQQSNIYAGMIIANIAAPFIGGVIISRLGYTYLFAVSLLLVLAGGILSFFIRLKIKTDSRIKLHPDFKGAFGSHMILILFRGVTFAMATWLIPLIIFDITKSEIALGSLGTVFSIIALFANLAGGFLIDRFYKKAIVAFYMASAFAWAAAGFFTGNIFFVILSIIIFFYSMINLGLNVLFFNAIENADKVALISERIMAFSLGGILLLVAHIFLPYNILFLICGGFVALSIPVLRKAYL